MNILYLAHRIPYPPNKGDKIRSFYQIRHLSKQHAVHLVCLVDEKEDLQHVATLEKYCASVDAHYRGKTTGKGLGLLALFTGRPLSVAAFYSGKLAQRVARRLDSQKIDRIFVFSSAMAEYVKNVAGIPSVIDFVDVDSAKWRLYAGHHRFPLSQIYRLEADRLARYEEAAAERFDHSLFVSEAEAALFRRQVKNRLISAIPNGVDLERFIPNDRGPSLPKEPVIVFTGAMDYFPNVDGVQYFCESIFPLIRQVLPEARFCIVGRNPTRQVSALGRQPNVTVTGSVPDVRPYLAQARVAVAPLRIARGIQNKILESMAMGLPVVGTSQVFGGIQAAPGDGVRVADAPEAFAQAVLELLGDNDLQRECSLRARRYVEHHHRWDAHGRRLEELLEKTGSQKEDRCIP